MKKKRTIGKWISWTLVLSMLISSVGIMPVFAGNDAQVQDDTFTYVALGDSITAGYGFDGYYSGKTMDYGGFRETDVTQAFPYKIKEKLVERYGTVDFRPLGIRGLRVEDLHVLLDSAYTGDDYTKAVFLDNDKNNYRSFASLGQFKSAAELSSEDEVELMAESYTDQQVKDNTNKLRNYFDDSIRKADLITFNFGTSNFGNYVIERLTDKLELYKEGMLGIEYHGYSDGIKDLFRDKESKKEVADELDDVRELVKDKVYEAIDENAEELPEGETTEDAKELADLVDWMMDVLCYCTVSYMDNYSECIAHIRALNPDADLVVVGLNNTMEGLQLDLTGMDVPDGISIPSSIDMGDICGAVIGLANLYMSSIDVNANNCYFVNTDIDESGTFSSELENKNISTELRKLIINDASKLLLTTETVEGGTEKYTYLDNINSVMAKNDGKFLKRMTILNKTINFYLKVEPLYAANVKPNTLISNFNQGFKMDAVASLTDGTVTLSNINIANLVYNIMEYVLAENAGNKTISLADVQALKDIDEDTVINSITLDESKIKENSSGLSTTIPIDASEAVRDAINELYSNYPGVKGIMCIFGRYLIAEGIGIHLNETGHTSLANQIIQTYNYGSGTKASSFSNEQFRKLFEEEEVYTDSDKNNIKIYNDSGIACTAVGDSMITGYGLGSGSTADASKAYPAVLTGSTGLNLDNQAENLGIEGLRMEDALCILDDSAAQDDYFGSALNITDEIKSNFRNSIRNANIITVDLGADNFGTYVIKQMDKALKGQTEYEMDMASRYGVNQKIVNDINAGRDAMEVALTEFAEDDDTLDELVTLLFSSVDSFIYSYFGFGTSYSKVLDKIREINPDAPIIIVGMHNLFKDLHYRDAAAGSKLYEFGNLIGRVIDMANLNYQAYAMEHNNCLYVDIENTETFADKDKSVSRNLADTVEVVVEGRTVKIPECIDYILDKNEPNFHPTAAGHSYIASQIKNEITLAANHDDSATGTLRYSSGVLYAKANQEGQYTLTFAQYNNSGKMLKSTMKSITLKKNTEVTVDIPSGYAPGSGKTVKVFFTGNSSGMKPVSQSCTIM